MYPPYKYIVEAVCDKIAAGMAYKGKEWNQKEPYEYWSKIEINAPVTKHPASIEFMNIVTKKISDEGLDAALNKKYLKEIYNNLADKYGIKVK